MPNDPFDFSQTDPSAPGLLGLPVSEWQNIARFGGNLASAANARTPQGFLANGPGLAGPLGAAVTGTMDQSRQNAVTRSALASQGASTQGQQISNLLASYGLPAAQAQSQLRTRALTEPGFLQNYMNQLQGGGASPSAAPTSLSPPGPQSQNSIPPDQRAPLVMGAVSGTPVPPAVLHGLIDYETGGTWDPNSVNKSSHAFGLQQSLPSTAADPGYGAPTISPNASPQEQAAFAAKYLAGRGAASGVKDWNDPTQVASALAAYHGPQKDANGIDGQMYAQQVMRRAQTFSQPGPGSFQVAQAGNGPLAMPAQQPQVQARPQPSPGTYTPGQAATIGRQFLQQADELDRQANAVAVGSSVTGLPMGDPAALRTRAQQTRQIGQQILGAGPQAAAKSANTPVDLREGGLGQVMGPDGMYWAKNPKTLITQDASGQKIPMHVTPAMPGDPEGTPGTAQPIIGPDGRPIVESQTPTQQAFQHTRGEHLAEQFNDIDKAAASAVQSNYLFDNLRNDSHTWQMGKFADIEGDARAWLSATAHAFGNENPGLDKPLADYTAFNKSSGQLLRTAVHDVSSRAAVQEYNMIGHTLPTPTTPEQGFGQVADQWQGLNDYKVAMQDFANRYRGNPEDFNVAFNANVSPTSFLLNRMSQTPQGQQDMQAMLHQMQGTPEGKMMAGRMLQQYNYAKQSGLFQSVDAKLATPQLNPTGGQ